MKVFLTMCYIQTVIFYSFGHNKRSLILIKIAVYTRRSTMIKECSQGFQ